MLTSSIVLSLIALTQTFPPLVLLPQGEVQGGYKTFGLAAVAESHLYRKLEPAFDRFVILPDVATVAATLSANGRMLSLTLNTEMAVDSDLTKLKVPLDKREIYLQEIHDQLSLELSSEFTQILNDLKEAYPSGNLQADDRRGGDRRMYRVRFSDINLDTLNESLNLLYRASIKIDRPFSIYLQVNEDRGIDLSKFKDMMIGRVGLSLQQIEIQESKVDLELPPLQEWSELAEGKIIPFYEGLRLLDETLLPHLMEKDSFALKSFPDVAWRRPFLEQAADAYFNDPSAPKQKTCDVYHVGVRNSASRRPISMAIYWPLRSKVTIPHRVTRT